MSKRHRKSATTAEVQVVDRDLGHVDDTASVSGSSKLIDTPDLIYSFQEEMVNPQADCESARAFEEEQEERQRAALERTVYQRNPKC